MKSTAIVLMLVGLALAGCTQSPSSAADGARSVGEPLPAQDRDIPEGYHSLVVETSYNGSHRPHTSEDDEGTDLPWGYPAIGLGVAVIVDWSKGSERGTWDYHRGCEIRYPHGLPREDCSDAEPYHDYIVPYPGAKRDNRSFYLLNESGALTLWFPTELEVDVNFASPYSSHLKAKMEDPDACDEPLAEHGDHRVRGDGVDRGIGQGPYVAVDGEAETTIYWYGYCKGGLVA